MVKRRAVWANRAVWAVWAFSVGACGPSPRPAPLSGNGWATVLGNERRSAYENEVISDSLQVAWDVNAGSGSRAPLLYTDSAVFLGTSNRQLLSFSTRTGRKLWDQRLEGEIPDQLVRSGRTLFFVTAEFLGRIHARDMERGRKVWRQSFGPARFSPTLEGGMVYVGNDRGVVAALRSDDGAEVWKTHLGGSVNTNLINAGDELFAITATDSIFAIAKKDGRVSRRAPLESSVSAPPALNGDTLVVPTHSGIALGVDARTFRVLWRVQTGAPILAAPVITSNGVVHLLNRSGDLWRISAGAGSRLSSLGGAVTASFVVARDRYVVGLVDGTLLLLDANGRILRRHQFNESIFAPAVIGGGALYLTLGRGRIVKLQ